MGVADQTPIVFLAMFWGGGGPYDIAGIIHVYDWINRDILLRDDLERALNYLLAAGLVQHLDGSFSIPEEWLRAFDEFRKRRRKSKFRTVRLFFHQLPQVDDVPRVVALTENDYNDHLAKYRQRFNG